MLSLVLISPFSSSWGRSHCPPGLVQCWITLVVCPGRKYGGLWGRLYYCIFVTLLEGMFCLGACKDYYTYINGTAEMPSSARFDLAYGSPTYALLILYRWALCGFFVIGNMNQVVISSSDIVFSGIFFPHRPVRFICGCECPCGVPPREIQ